MASPLTEAAVSQQTVTPVYARDGSGALGYAAF